MLNALDVVKWVILIMLLVAMIAAFVGVATAVISAGQSEYASVKAGAMDTGAGGGYMVHDLWSSFWQRGLEGADDSWDWVQGVLLGLGSVFLTVALWRFARGILG